MPAPVHLTRGSNTALSELMPVLGTVVVGFGWRVIESHGPQPELVPAAIVCDQSGEAISPDHMVFFNQLAAPDGATRYVDGGDEEQIEIDLQAIPDHVDRVVFVVYADPDLRRPGNFGQVREAYFRISDRSGSELVRYRLEEGSGVEVTAMIFGELYRHRGAWKVRAVGQGYSTGVLGVAKDFGLQR